jgi:Protein of unknown function (DUF3775)
MLTVPIETIADLLDKASLVELSVLEMIEDEDLSETEAEEEAAPDEEEEEDNEDAAYRDLAAAIDRLPAAQIYELLTLAQLGAEESEADTWDEAAAEARAIPADVATEELIRTLVLTDAIETALEQLGYTFEEEDDEVLDEEDEDEEDEDDEDKDEAGPGKGKPPR